MTRKDRETIEKVMDEILKEEIDFFALKNKFEKFKSLLLNITKLDLGDQSNKEDIHFENGMALSPTFAALCLDDIIRTRQFIRGIHKAVKQVGSKNRKPIKILYAGTGPFATLILPILTKYNPDELQLILLEVNRKTLSYLKKTIKHLGIEPYIEGIICEDATKIKLEEINKIDILISETMQHGLVKEQQVPIMLNLIPQMGDDAIIIPNNIKLDLALMNSSSKTILEESSKSRYKKIKKLLDFDKQFILSHIKSASSKKMEGRFELCKQLPFRDDSETEFDKLVVLTSIHVHDEEWIHTDSSGLTIPKALFGITDIAAHKKKISLSYVTKSNPDFEYELN